MQIVQLNIYFNQIKLNFLNDIIKIIIRAPSPPGRRIMFETSNLYDYTNIEQVRGRLGQFLHRSLGRTNAGPSTWNHHKRKLLRFASHASQLDLNNNLVEIMIVLGRWSTSKNMARLIRVSTKPNLAYYLEFGS